MDIKEIAKALDGREYGDEVDDLNLANLKECGIVVVFGYSDDNVEFRGAIDDEIGCYGGRTGIPITPGGLLVNKCDSEDCPYFGLRKGEGVLITPLWGKEGFSWIYETAIPHETFIIMEDGEPYCRGIVFDLNNLGGPYGN